MRVTIFGSGYVGLVTGACLADAGNDVLCVDVDAKKIEGLKRGEIPIHEPGLDALIKTNAEAERLRFTTSAAEGVAHGQLQLIAVGTPPDEDGSADLKYVLAVARSIGEHMTEYKVVVTKSTVPVGTADKVGAAVAESLQEARSRTRIRRGVEPGIPQGRRGHRRLHASGPRGRRARTIRASPSCMRALYEPFTRSREKVIVMDVQVRGADQVRRQRHARDQDQLHERAGESRRAIRRRHREGARGHRFGSAHRLPLHLPGPGLRRFVFPEGRAGAGAFGARRELRAEAARLGRGGEQGAEASAVREDHAATTAAISPARPSRSGAWPSSPAPTTCARRRAAC